MGSISKDRILHEFIELLKYDNLTQYPFKILRTCHARDYGGL